MVSSAEPSSSGAGTPSGRARGLVLKALLLLGGALLLKRMRKSATRWDHARAVTNSLVGEKLSSYAIRDVEEYKNYCDRPKGQKPQPEEVIGDIAEHLTTIHLSRCQRGKRCLYEGSSSLGGFPNTWGGASYCSSDLTIHKNGEIHTWDRGYDEEGNQVWGQRTGSYEFKSARLSNNGDMFSPLNSRLTFSLDKMESSFVVNEQ